MGGRKKPWLELAGEPLLLHALRPFLARLDVVAIRVALSVDDASDPPRWLTELDPRVETVRGGASRAASVREAIRALPDEVEIIAVHDGARPLVDGEVVSRCLAVAREGWGAVAAHPAVDTLKRVDEEGRIVETPRRARLWHAQTPQVFPAALLREAYEALGDDPAAEVTDDASVVEGAGGTVVVVESPPSNLKVTRPGDLPLAAFHLGRRGAGSAPAPSARGDSGGAGAPGDRPSGPRGVEVAGALDHLRAGGVLAYPTETVYGFGCRLDGEALGRLRELKSREEGPFLLLIEGMSGARDLEWSAEARLLAEAVWPGPLTLVLPDPGKAYPAAVRGPTGGVAVRDTPHPVARRLVQALGEPLTSTSANRRGEPPARSPGEVSRVLEGLDPGARVAVLHGGTLPPSPPSTIVDCTSHPPRVLREGALPVATLRDVVPEIVFEP
jgi:tRNA threonylcarbamoyl adenosine modification protein (Sua5/YciO/YrdC/YwlC family)